MLERTFLKKIMDQVKNTILPSRNINKIGLRCDIQFWWLSFRDIILVLAVLSLKKPFKVMSLNPIEI